VIGGGTLPKRGWTGTGAAGGACPAWAAGRAAPGPGGRACVGDGALREVPAGDPPFDWVKLEWLAGGVFFGQ